MLTPPSNPLCCYIGRGCALCEWTAPDEDVRYYEIYISTNNYTFTLCQSNIFNTKVMLRGLPVNKTIYLKIRSVYFSSGIEQYSDFCYMKKASTNNNPITMRVTSVNGSKILAGSLFNFLDRKAGRIISLAASEEINICRS